MHREAALGRRAGLQRSGEDGHPFAHPEQPPPPAGGAGLALTVYRIVQEALTNAARHAGGSRVGVSLRYEPDAVDIAVVDDGGERATQTPGGGRGLLGMRERVTVFAGTLETGPSPDGGFSVHARLPLPREDR